MLLIVDQKNEWPLRKKPYTLFKPLTKQKRQGLQIRRRKHTDGPEANCFVNPYGIRIKRKVNKYKIYKD